MHYSIERYCTHTWVELPKEFVGPGKVSIQGRLKIKAVLYVSFCHCKGTHLPSESLK